ncbi:MAG: hypothetical protein KDE09_12920 [Anaerolineales bacterium]|nr:hypothetical protein [Anaerolineales bacterium]MCB8958919.1 hypothetical protein [Ardenticatenales bacterium]
MATHRVFLIWTHPLFREVVRLSSTHPDFVWVGDTSDQKAALSEIAATCPDTIVIEDVGDDHLNGVMDLLRSCAPNVRVIVMNLNDNKLNLYQHREQYLTRADELISLILQDNDSF